MYIILLLSMIFCHIVDDYYLQGWLASAKQKIWWENNAPDEMYKNDYKMALLMHSFSWSFMIMLPLTIFCIVTKQQIFEMWYFINMFIHYCVDDLKANQKKINLVQDQLIHIGQIVMTWVGVLTFVGFVEV